MNDVIACIDRNIVMFERYAPTPDVVSKLERFRADRAVLVEYFNNERTRESMPYSAREWLYEMPAWGTYGT